MAKTKYDCMKHFSLFLSNPGGWSLLAQLWKASLKEIRGGMGSLPGKVLAPPQGQRVLKWAQRSQTSP